MLLRTSALVLALLGLTRPAAADEPTTTPRTTGTVGLAMLGSNAGGGLGIDGRLRFRNGVQLGLASSAQELHIAYFGGRTVQGAVASETSVLALLPLAQTERLELSLRVATGVRFLRDVSTITSQYEVARRVVTEIAFLAHVRVGTRGLFRAGAIVAVEIETRPTTAMADQLQLLSVGFGYAVSPRVLLYGTAEAGGAYGFDGDNGKVVARGALGLRIPLGSDVRTSF